MTVQTDTGSRPRLRRAEREMETRTLVAFILLTFGLCWGLGVMLALFPDQIEAMTGPVSMTNPLFILAVYSPAIAGIGLVWWHFGLQGLGRYFRRLLMWRMPRVWWAYLVFGIPAVFYLGAAIKGEGFDLLPFSPWYSVLPALGFTMILGPMEEFGWRGVALPLLLHRMRPILAGLVIAVWATWHLPAFLMEGTPQSQWSFGGFFVGLVAIELTLTPMFEVARGSILIPMLYHFQLNCPIWPDAQPYDSYIFVVIAVVVVALNRRRMFARGEAPTDVVPPVAANVVGTSAGGAVEATPHEDRVVREAQPLVS